jgi:hypothetical protein
MNNIVQQQTPQSVQAKSSARLSGNGVLTPRQQRDRSKSRNTKTAVKTVNTTHQNFYYQ